MKSAVIGRKGQNTIIREKTAEAASQELWSQELYCLSGLRHIVLSPPLSLETCHVPPLLESYRAIWILAISHDLQVLDTFSGLPSRSSPGHISWSHGFGHISRYRILDISHFIRILTSFHGLQVFNMSWPSVFICLVMCCSKHNTGIIVRTISLLTPRIGHYQLASLNENNFKFLVSTTN